MNMVKKLVVSALAFSACVSVNAADLVLTVSDGVAKSSSSRMSLDVATEGNVSGFNFVVALPAEVKRGSIDVSKCLSDLPKGFSGDCRHSGNAVYVFAMANDNSVLPAGILSIGSLGLPGNLAKSDSIAIEQLVFADVKGDPISSSHQIAR